MKRVRILMIALLGMVLLTAMESFAHHSAAKSYDLNRTMTLSGIITKVEWVNPHAHLYVETRNDDGRFVTWDVEFPPPHTVIRLGVTPMDLRVRDEVTVDVSVALDGSNRAAVRRLTLRDGRVLGGLPAGWQ